MCGIIGLSRRSECSHNTRVAVVVETSYARSSASPSSSQMGSTHPDRLRLSVAFAGDATIEMRYLRDNLNETEHDFRPSECGRV